MQAIDLRVSAALGVEVTHLEHGYLQQYAPNYTAHNLHLDQSEVSTHAVHHPLTAHIVSTHAIHYPLTSARQVYVPARVASALIFLEDQPVGSGHTIFPFAAGCRDAYEAPPPSLSRAADPIPLLSHPYPTLAPAPSLALTALRRRTLRSSAVPRRVRRASCVVTASSRRCGRSGTRGCGRGGSQDATSSPSATAPRSLPWGRSISLTLTTSPSPSPSPSPSSSPNPNQAAARH